jgi:hypothetical protein
VPARFDEIVFELFLALELFEGVRTMPATYTRTGMVIIDPPAPRVPSEMPTSAASTIADSMPVMNISSIVYATPSAACESRRNKMSVIRYVLIHSNPLLSSRIPRP